MGELVREFPVTPGTETATCVVCGKTTDDATVTKIEHGPIGQHRYVHGQPSPAVGLKALAILYGSQACRGNVLRTAPIATILSQLEDRTGVEIDDGLIDDIQSSWLIGWDLEYDRRVANWPQDGTAGYLNGS